jgi:oxygen-independent coproporphyrinogen-3 oxidase
MRHATDTPKSPEAWLRAVETNGNGEIPRTPLPLTEQATEYLLFSLRLAEGMDLPRYEALSGRPVDPKKLEHLEEIGMITLKQGRIFPTDAGRAVLNALILELMP